MSQTTQPLTPVAIVDPGEACAPAAAKTPRRREASTQCLTVPAILSGIADAGEAVRRRVVAEFRRLGGSLDGLARGRRDRGFLADALTAIEGQLELEMHGRPTHARTALLGVRRRLERELWP